MEAERQEKITQLKQRRSKLTADEILLLQEVFLEIIDEHREQVWRRLRRRFKDDHDAEDLLQEVFLDLHSFIVDRGFPDSLVGMLRTFTKRKVLNHVRAKKRVPISIGLASSGSLGPTSVPDLERALDLRELVRSLVTQLSPEHREVIDKVILKDLSDSDAAAALGIPLGTVRSRLLAAKLVLHALAAPLVPPSQRGLR